MRHAPSPVCASGKRPNPVYACTPDSKHLAQLPHYRTPLRAEAPRHWRKLGLVPLHLADTKPIARDRPRGGSVQLDLLPTGRGAAPSHR